MFGFGKAIEVVGGAISTVTNKIWADKNKILAVDAQLAELQLKLGQEGKMAEFKDIAQSRLMYAKELQRAPWAVRLLNGLVRPVGGMGAVITVFWVIWATYFGYPPLKLPDIPWNNPIWMTIQGIISFFFVLRHNAQVKGVKDK